MSPTVPPSPSDASFMASINDQFTRAFSAYNQPLEDNFNQAAADWLRNDPVLAVEAKSNPSVLRPAFPTPPMLKRLDLGIVDQIFMSYTQSLMNGVHAVLDISAAVTVYQMPFTPPASAPAAPARPANPVGAEMGIGSGAYSDKDGDDRTNGAGYYLVGIPFRLHVLPTPFGVRRFFLIDWTLPASPSPMFTGDAA